MKNLNLNNFISSRLDIIVKILFIESYIKNENHTFYSELYLKHIKYRKNFKEDSKNSKEDFYNSFINLIKSIKNDGFNKKYPIEINNEGYIISGAHRLACSIYFGIEPEILIINKKGKKWDYNWFIKNTFNLEERLLISKKYYELFNFKIVVLYKKYKTDNIISSFRKEGNIIGIETLKFKDLLNPLDDIYSFYGLNLSTTIIKKGIELNKSKREIDILFVDNISFERITQIKNNLRKKYEEKDKYIILHGPDSKEENEHLANIFLSSNNIRNLQLRNGINYSSNFIKNLEELKKVTKQNNINDYCIVGSAILEAFGLIKNRDIDIIINQNKREKIINKHSSFSLSKNIDVVAKNYSFIYKDEDIINNSNLYFYFKGIKFTNLEILKEHKLKNSKKKNIKHIKLINSILNNQKINFGLKLSNKITGTIMLTKLILKTYIIDYGIILTKKLHIYNFISKKWRKYILKR